MQRLFMLLVLALTVVTVANAEYGAKEMSNQAVQVEAAVEPQKEGKVMPAYVGSAQFEKIKSLAGTWQGPDTMNPQGGTITVTYAVTGNGSSVVETLFPDTPMEMVTMYYEEEGKVRLTHYCALGNHPEMELISDKDQRFEFQLAADSDVKVDTQAHMHSLILSFSGTDEIIHSWGMFEAGKEQGKHDFTLTRVK